jgi:hypothetical protein
MNIYHGSADLSLRFTFLFLLMSDDTGSCRSEASAGISAGGFQRSCKMNGNAGAINKNNQQEQSTRTINKNNQQEQSTATLSSQSDFFQWRLQERDLLSFANKRCLSYYPELFRALQPETIGDS